MEQELNPKAMAMADALFPTVGRRRMQWLADLDPEFARLFADFTYGGLYSREVLDQRTRELCAVAALAALSFPNQLASHIRAALLAGASREEVQEAIVQMCVYGGWPAALTGLETMKRVYGEIDGGK